MTIINMTGVKPKVYPVEFHQLYGGGAYSYSGNSFNKYFQVTTTHTSNGSTSISTFEAAPVMNPDASSPTYAETRRTSNSGTSGGRIATFKVTLPAGMDTIYLKLRGYVYSGTSTPYTARPVLAGLWYTSPTTSSTTTIPNGSSGVTSYANYMSLGSVAMPYGSHWIAFTGGDPHEFNLKIQFSESQSADRTMWFVCGAEIDPGGTDGLSTNTAVIIRFTHGEYYCTSEVPFIPGN